MMNKKDNINTHWNAHLQRYVPFEQRTEPVKGKPGSHAAPQKPSMKTSRSQDDDFDDEFFDDGIFDDEIFPADDISDFDDELETETDQDFDDVSEFEELGGL